MKSSSILIGLSALLMQFVIVASASAQHPIEIERKVADGKHFEALAQFDRMPRRKITVGSRVAAAKAAWALSLPERASEEFEVALQAGELSTEDSARVLLSKGIIEYQEERYQVSNLFAEKVIEQLKEPGPLRGTAWTLWGDGLKKLGKLGAAEEKYQHAIEEVANSQIPDISFRLGMVQHNLGKIDKAKENLQNIPLQHERTPQAIRTLADIALVQGNVAHAHFWLQKGRSEYPEKFLDSWVEYAALRVAIEKSDTEQVREVRDTAAKRYPESDPWITLLNAAAESYEWQHLNQTPTVEEK